MTCKYCGNELKITFRGSAKYCSKECCRKFHNRNKSKYKECKICGKALDGKQRLYCSEKCKKKGKAILEMNYHSTQYKKPTIAEREQKKPKMSIAQINALARTENLTYGQYLAKHGLY